ncbi:hypothetical protein [Nitrososphaera viennensis]|uniref:Uncharacterized protein n=1 Tax=Nitrososphaera viennensis TaxID=1034015 RepID=A0A977IG66_9ARCH|nr:hypothetical protein [Nitrososphaera viennensis]UVS70148.1 hypothetical protein NWT39_05005 [Nitrososphaera viennensis]
MVVQSCKWLLMEEEEGRCCVCDKAAEIFYDGLDYCVKCWQEKMTAAPVLGEFYN